MVTGFGASASASSSALVVGIRKLNVASIRLCVTPRMAASRAKPVAWSYVSGATEAMGRERAQHLGPHQENFHELRNSSFLAAVRH